MVKMKGELGGKDKIQDSWGGKEQDLVEMRKWEWVESCH